MEKYTTFEEEEGAVDFCWHPHLKVKPLTQKKQAAFRLHLLLLMTPVVCKY